MIEFEPFDLTDCGIALDDLGIRPANPLPDLPPSWRRRWWHDTGHETLEDHARAVIERYARPVLAREGASVTDAIFEQGGEMVSLDDLLAPFRFPLTPQ